MTAPADMIDTPLLIAINNFAQATPWLHAPMKVLSNYGFITALLVVLWLAALRLARRAESPSAMAVTLWAPVAVLTSTLLKELLGSMVSEVRPCRAVPAIVAIAKCGKGYSFPSNHSAIAGAAAAALLLLTRGLLAWIGVLAALLIAFSRVYLAVHYPHDVLAGLLLGAAVSVVGWLLLRKPLTRAVEGMRRGAIAPLVTTSR